MCTLARVLHRKFLRMDRFHVTVVCVQFEHKFEIETVIGYCLSFPPVIY